MISKTSNLFKDMSDASGRPTTVDEKIDAAMVELVYSQTLIGLIASLVCATIILFGLQGTADKISLTIWYGLFVLVTLARSILASTYRARNDLRSHVIFWRSLFITGAFLGGLMWGVTGSLLFPVGHLNEQVLIVLVIAGMTSGAVPVLAPVRSAALAFMIPALLPLLVTLVYNQVYLLFDMTLAIYLVYLMALTFRMYNTIRESISIQFQNSDLLANLSEAKQQLEIINKKLEQVATHDPLTNVPNRNLFSLYLQEAIERSKVNRKIFALLYLDIDGFKEINDTCGHHVGDQLLLVLVDRLDQLLDDPKALARLGGDEFTVILDHIADPNEVAKIAGRICHAIAQPVTIDQHEIKVSSSVGIAIYPIDGDNAKALLSVADKAMYYVKDRGGNDFRFNVTLQTDQ